MLILLMVLTALSVGFGVYAASVPKTSPNRFLRYAGLVQAPVPTQNLQLEAALRALALWVAARLPANYIKGLRGRLRQAGWNGPLHYEMYLCAQAGSAIGGALLGLVLAPRFALVAVIAGAALCGILPVVVLNARLRERRKAIDRALPDSLDMMTTCVEAGLGLDAAIAQLTRRKAAAFEAINDEFSRYLQELQLGVSRPEALKNLAMRAGVDDMKTAIGALIQGEQLGVGVAQVLRSQASYLRLSRKQRAEEQAMKAPIKLLFPLLFGIFPSIFVLLLGPAALRLMDTFGTGAP